MRVLGAVPYSRVPEVLAGFECGAEQAQVRDRHMLQHRIGQRCRLEEIHHPGRDLSSGLPRRRVFIMTLIHLRLSPDVC